MIYIGTIDHHAAEDGELGYRRPYVGKVGAEQAAIERQRLQRPAAHRRRACLLLVVRMQRIWPELDVRMRLERRDRVRAAAQERLAQRHRRTIADDLVEISSCLLDGVIGADCRCMLCIGNPCGAGRERRGAADILRALDQQHLPDLQRGKQRGGQAGGAGTEHDDVELAVVGNCFERREHRPASLSVAVRRTAGNRPSCSAAPGTFACRSMSDSRAFAPPRRSARPPAGL